MYYSDQNNIESEPIVFLTRPVSEKEENMLTLPTSDASSDIQDVLCPQWNSPIVQYLRNA